jgi:hypothetical protein
VNTTLTVCRETNQHLQRRRKRRKGRRTESDPAVEKTRSVHQVKVSLSVVTLARLVDVGLGEEEEVRSRLVPLHLDLVSLVEGLLARLRGESDEGVDLDGSGSALWERDG